MNAGVVPLAAAELGSVRAEIWPKAAYESRDAGGSGIIGFAFEAQEGEDAIGSDRVRHFRRGANTLAWIPPGCSVFSASGVGGEYLVLRGFPADAIRHAEAAGRPVNDLVDAAAVAAARSLRRLLLSGRADAEQASAAVEDLRAALLCRFQNGPGRAAGWLTAGRLRALDRLIDARLAERIEVVDIAAELDLSVGFLVLAVRGGLGMTPHRYVMERRLACARAELATDGRKSLAQIALDCGFADQAHLARHLRQTLGLTPTAYRRLLSDRS